MRPAACSTRTRARPARSARSTTAAATCGSRSTGPRSWPSQTDDAELAAKFSEVAQALSDNESTISQELVDAQGHSVDIGGYYRPDADKVATVMRPSTTFNEIIAALP